MSSFHERKAVVIALAVGGLVALAKDIAALVAELHRFALTPSGLAALVVASILLSVTTLVVLVLRR